MKEKGRSGGIFRTILFSLTATAMVFAVAEGILRLASLAGFLDLPPPVTVRDVWAEAGWKVDRDLNWALLPNYTSTRGGAVCRTNSHGLRDQEIPLEKSPGTRRILVLGDSTVLGFAIPFEDTFCEVLEKMLNESSDSVRYDVINAGVPGYSIYNCFVYLKRDGILFDPDVVVLETNFNDRRYILSREYEDGEKFYRKFYYRLRLREFLSHSYIYRAARKLIVDVLGLTGGDLLTSGEFDYSMINLEELHFRIEPGRYRGILGEMIRFLGERGIPLVLIPLRDPPSYVGDYYRACSIAESGGWAESVEILQEMYKIPFYRIIVARKINEILERAGRPGQKIRSIPIPLEWMSTDGNIPVYLCDPYVDAMKEAAATDGVFYLEFDPISEGGGEIYLDYIHLNRRGHRLLAGKLYELLTEKVLPRSRIRGS